MLAKCAGKSSNLIFRLKQRRMKRGGGEREEDDDDGEKEVCILIKWHSLAIKTEGFD